MTNQHPSLPWNFVTHGFLNPSALPEEGHHPRGTTLREALWGNLRLGGVLRGLCGGLFEASARLCGATGFSEGSDPMLVTPLRNYWSTAGPGISSNSPNSF